MTAIKHDQDKPRLSLMPGDALLSIAQAFTFGARKYSDHNWCDGFNWSRLQDSLLRHVTAWSVGEDLDPESGLPHLAHAGCCCLMLLAHTLRGIGTDDRYKVKSPETNT